MKKLFLMQIIILMCVISELHAQWEKVAEYNVGATGQIAVHGSTVFVYGYDGQQFVYRSSDNGITWINVADKFPDKVYYMHSHGNEVLAIVGINQVYSSADEGLNWSFKSSVAYSGGAIQTLVSDGQTLYALSNRSSVFKSDNNGSTWTEIKINYPDAQVFGIDFAALGNKMVFVALNLGSFISLDGGTTWALKNPSIIISSVHSFNSEFYGSTYGMYKLTGDAGWTSITSGFPAGIGVTASTRSTVSIGNKLFTYYADVIVGSKIFTSEDNGNSWSELGNNLTASSASSLNDFIAATSEYLYYYLYAIFDNNAKGIYRYKISSSTAVEKTLGNIPEGFRLDQNYPNPFNPTTEISFSVPKKAFVNLKVYDSIGREIANLVENELNPGTYSINFNAAGLSSGIYYCRMTAENFTGVKKLLLMK